MRVTKDFTKKLSAEEISFSYNQLTAIIERVVGKERQKKIFAILKHFEDRILISPASSREEFHGCFPGGWLLHTNNVITNTLELFSLWNKKESLKGVTLEEAVVSALFHDLGKLGTIDEPYYVLNKSQWHVDRGMFYEINNKIEQYSSVGLRSLFLLQHFGFKLTENEYYSILLADGLFDDMNKMYFRRLKSNLPVLIHHADHMSALSEKEKV